MSKRQLPHFTPGSSYGQSILPGSEQLAARTVQGVSPEDSRLREIWGLAEPSSAGIIVDETTAQNVSTVYSCVTLISQILAMLPIGCFKKLPNDDREIADQHPSHWIFNKSPDEIIPAYNFREATQGHVLLRGNAYSEIVRNFRGQAVDLHLLDPRKVSVELKTVDSSNVPTYYYTQPVGPREEFDYSEIFHIANWSTNGVVGITPLTMFRESLGLAIAANRYASEYFRKGGHPLGFLTKPNIVGKKERDTLRDEWMELHGGVENSHQIGILSGGLDWKNIGLTNQDAQLLGLRQFQKYEIASIFRVPPFLLGDVEQPLGNIELLLIQFLIFTLLPWMKRWEGMMNLRMFTRIERFSYYLEFNADALLRGDNRSRQEAFQIMARNGSLLIDEWRAYENKPRLPDGMGQIPMIMASQIAKLEDVISGKVNLDTSPAPKSKSKAKPSESQRMNRIAQHYSKLSEHDRERIKGLLASMNGKGTL